MRCVIIRRVVGCIRGRRCVTSATASASRRALFLSPVWPERSSSAAGVRSSELLQGFQRWGFQVAWGAAATPNEHTQLLGDAGVPTYQVLPNREAELAAVLAAERPDVVVMDRFYAEEYWSWVVREQAPEALRVLDMQDMHSLRAAREAAAKAGASQAEVLACLPDASAPDCLRELAAIHRSDLTLVCGTPEMQLLAGRYGIPPHKLALAPLFYPPSPHDPSSPAAAAQGAAACPGFGERRHVMMIGNWRHNPNADSVRQAVALWPAVRAALGSDVELHLYGSYAPGSAVQQYHRPRQGIHLKGFAPSLDVMLSYRLLLAPLRFGAGLKGKVADAWWHGLPVVTTGVGAEGMLPPGGTSLPPDPATQGYIWQEGGAAGSSSGSPSSSGSSGAERAACGWGGACGSSTAEELAADTVRLYTDASAWQAAQAAGFALVRQLFDRDSHLEGVHVAVEAALAQREQRRSADWVGGMLWQQQLRATQFMGRYIELKESLAR